MTVQQFQHYHTLIQRSINRDLKIDLVLAILAIVVGIILTIWIGPEAGILGGAFSAIMFGRYYINKGRLPYFIKGNVIRKWEEERMHRNIQDFYFYAELTNTKSIQKNKNNEIVEAELPTNYSAEIFAKGYPKVTEGAELVLCFSGAGIYLGFVMNEEFVSYWD